MKMINRISFVIFAILVAAFAVTPASAQKETPPEGGTPKSFVFPKQDTYTLDNGLKVTLVQYGAVPKVRVELVVRAGGMNEKEGQQRISEIVATMLKEGTKTRSSADIAREVAEMGGTIFSASDADRTYVRGDVLSEFDARFIALLADVVRNPKFAAEDFENAREAALRDRSVAMARAGTIASKAFFETLFPGHVYGSIIADEEQIKAYELEDAKNFHATQFGALRTHLYVVGQFDTASVKKAIEASLGDWKKGSAPIRNVPVPTSKRSIQIIDRPGAPQSTIRLGMPGPSPSDADFYKFTVMNTLLGGSFGSRITANIREDKGYTYSPSSAHWTNYKTGYWYEGADVTTEATGASIKEILFEIDRLSKEAPSAKELQGIKNYLVGIYVLQNSTRGGVVGRLESRNYNELDNSYIDNYVDKITAVTAKDVQEMAAKYLVPEKMTIVVVGDLSKIEKQLEPYKK